MDKHNRHLVLPSGDRRTPHCIIDAGRGNEPEQPNTSHDSVSDPDMIPAHLIAALAFACDLVGLDFDLATTILII